MIYGDFVNGVGLNQGLLFLEYFYNLRNGVLNSKINNETMK